MMPTCFDLDPLYSSPDVALAYQTALGGPVPAITVFSTGGGYYAEIQADLTPAQLTALQAALQTYYYNEARVYNANDVDNQTIARIYELLAPGKPPALQAAAEKALQSKNQALLTTAHFRPLTSDEQAELQANLTTWAAVEVIRQEGRDYKTARGWSNTPT